MAELKPCPFCGGMKLKIEHKAAQSYKRRQGVEQYTFSVRCNKCHARGGTITAFLRNAFYALSDEAAKIMETREQAEARAAEAWNRRADNG